MGSNSSFFKGIIQGGDKMTDQEVKQFCEKYFSPLSCTVKIDINYDDRFKFIITVKDKKQILDPEPEIWKNKLYSGQEVDKGKLISYLDSIKELLRRKGFTFDS